MKIAASWRGQVTRTTNGLPFFGSYEDCPDILYGHGYCGNGVGPARLGGKILASLALGLKDEWSSSPLVSGPPAKRLAIGRNFTLCPRFFLSSFLFILPSRCSFYRIRIWANPSLFAIDAGQLLG